MDTNNFSFGDKAEDTVSGFVGIITAFAEYATGCNQILISPKAGKKGDYRDGHWFDVERVKILQKSHTTIRTSPSGGPRGAADTAPVR